MATQWVHQIGMFFVSQSLKVLVAATLVALYATPAWAPGASQVATIVTTAS